VTSAPVGWYFFDALSAQSSVLHALYPVVGEVQP
jgi:hypothetical protein